MEKRRIVVKVGTSTLCHGGKGLNFRNIDLLAQTLSDIKTRQRGDFSSRRARSARLR
jgi:glutamate 5-kinase